MLSQVIVFEFESTMTVVLPRQALMSLEEGVLLMNVAADRLSVQRPDSVVVACSVSDINKGAGLQGGDNFRIRSRLGSDQRWFNNKEIALG